MKRREFLLGVGGATVALTKAARSRARRFREEATVGDFIGRLGATDGAVQGAIDEAVKSGIAVVRLPALAGGKAYEVESSIQNHGVQLVGEGAATRLRKVGPGSCFVSGRVPRTNIVQLLTEIPAGTDRIDFSSCPGLLPQAGAVYVLTSERHCHANTPAHCGEFVVVNTVSNGVAVLDRPLVYSYDPSENACMREAGLVAGVGYRNLRIEMDPAVVPTMALERFDNYGLQLDFCLAPSVIGVSISNGVAAGIRLLGCIDARVEDYAASNLGSAEDDRTGASTIGLGGYGYGIAERGLNRGLIVERAITDSVRHLYTSAAEWADIFKFGMPTDSLIANSISRNAKAANFDTHESGTNITFANCRADGGKAVGFQLRSKQAKVIGCDARNLAGAAVWVYGANVHENAAGDGCVVSGLHCENTNNGHPTTYGANIEWGDTGAILDQGFHNEFKSLHIERCAGPAVTIAPAARGGAYENITVSRICEATQAMPYVIVVEQNTADEPPKFNGLRVFESPRAKSLMKITDARCRPLLSGFTLRLPIRFG